MATIVQRLVALRNELDSILLELEQEPKSPKSHQVAEAPNAPKKVKIMRSKEELDSIKDIAKKAYEAIQSESEPEPKKVIISKKVLKRTDNEIVKNRLQAEKDAMDAFKKL